MNRNAGCRRRAELASESARLVSQRAAQVGSALTMLAQCHIDRVTFEHHLADCRRALAEAEALGDEFDCADRVASEAA